MISLYINNSIATTNQRTCQAELQAAVQVVSRCKEAPVPSIYGTLTGKRFQTSPDRLEFQFPWICVMVEKLFKRLEKIQLSVSDFSHLHFLTYQPLPCPLLESLLNVKPLSAGVQAKSSRSKRSRSLLLRPTKFGSISFILVREIISHQATSSHCHLDRRYLPYRRVHP